MKLSLSFDETDQYTDEYLQEYIVRLEMALKEAYTVKHYRKGRGWWSLPKKDDSPQEVKT